MLDLVRQEVVRAASTIVVKIGTNVLADRQGRLDYDHAAHLAEQFAELVQGGKRLAVVSSGAIGAGMGRLGLTKRPTEWSGLQAAAAVGQCSLINAYDAPLRKHGLSAAQVLLTADDFEDRNRYLSVREMMLQLFRWNAIPIINENDSISVAEIRYGDNDHLAALVTNLLQAQLLIILSVAEGLYAGDFQSQTHPTPISLVESIDESTFGLAQSSTSGLGTGGMKSKLQAVRQATSAGESVWIAGGKIPNVLRRIMQAEDLGTLFLAKGESKAAWKRWVGFSVRPRGTLRVDAGAADALRKKGRSLLPVGIVEVTGEFAAGDVVAVVDADSREFARGISLYDSTEVRRLVDQAKRPADANLPTASRFGEVIHRDNLVLL